MRQPGADARSFRADSEGAGIPRLRSDDVSDYARSAAGIPAPRAPATKHAAAGRGGTDRSVNPRLPPGQYVQASMPVLHYGRVPAPNRRTWDLRVYGATDARNGQGWDWDGFRTLPLTEVVADFHCVTKFSVLGITWLGVSATEILRAVAPAVEATHVMVWADFGYGANLPLDVFGAADTLLATHRDGKELSPEQGHPVRLVVPSRYGWKSVKWVRAIEYLIGDRRGFWEERGYHNNADPWQEQRFSYQELPGEGPPL